MFIKQWVTEFQGHSIRVTNSWFGGAKLYIDGECRDVNTDTFAVSVDAPVLRARIDPNNMSSSLVEVFCKAIITVKAKIHIDGKKVAGDDI
jgi:hypothetical protein